MHGRSLLLVALVVGAALAAPSSAIPVVGMVGERAVEGHTVYAVIEGHHEQRGSATISRETLRVPAGVPDPVSPRASGEVRWFNDQELVAAGGAAVAVLVQDDWVGNPRARYPCTGSVLLVHSGTPDPRGVMAFAPLSYQESYIIEDPNEKVWIIDMFRMDYRGVVYPVWAAALGGNEVGRSVPDDGSANCAPSLDGAMASSPGDHGAHYPDGGHAAGSLLYNALLFMPFVQFMPHEAGPLLDHGAFHARDVSACHDAGCPDADDGAEGNSHAYHPFPALRREGAHGSVPGCQRCHQTQELALYYWTAPDVPIRNFALVDQVGAFSPV